MEFSAHIQDWLATSLTVEGLFLFVLLLLATLFLGGATEGSGASGMALDFIFLAGGAFLGHLYFPEMPSVLAPGPHLIVALFSGMTVAGLINIVLFKPT